MSRTLLTLLVVALLLIVEGVLHARTRLFIDLGAIIIAYMVLERPIVSGAAMALFVGYLQDLCAGAPTGLFAAGAVLAFLVVRVGVSKLRWSGVVFSTVVAVVTALVALVTVVAVDAVLGPGHLSLHGAIPALPSLAISTILLCYPVHRLLGRIDERLARSDEELVLR